MRQTQQGLGGCLANRFGVPPPGGPGAEPPKGGTPYPLPDVSAGFLQHILTLSILAFILNSLNVCAQDAGFGPAISVPHDLPEARLGALPARNRTDQTPE